jgi:TPR repeat protein
MSRRTCWLSVSARRFSAKTIFRTVTFFSLILACLFPAFAVAQQSSSSPDGLLENYKTLAKKGDAQAQIKLADLYRTGKDVPQNFPEAAKWYRSAAEQGLPEGQFKLGELLFDGKGVAQDSEEASKWLEKAAAQGHQAAKDKLEEIKSKTRDGLKDLNKALDMIR